MENDVASGGWKIKDPVFQTPKPKLQHIFKKGKTLQYII